MIGSGSQDVDIPYLFFPARCRGTKMALAIEFRWLNISSRMEFRNQWNFLKSDKELYDEQRRTQRRGSLDRPFCRRHQRYGRLDRLGGERHRADAKTDQGADHGGAEKEYEGNLLPLVGGRIVPHRRRFFSPRSIRRQKNLAKSCRVAAFTSVRKISPCTCAGSIATRFRTPTR